MSVGAIAMLGLLDVAILSVAELRSAEPDGLMSLA